MSAQLSREELQIRLDRPIGLKGRLYDFVQMAWPIVEPGNAYQDNWHVPVICEHLEAFTKGEIQDLLINVPPGCMKSLLVGVFWPAWVWIRTPGFRLIGASYDIGLTRRDAGKSLQIIHSDWYQKRWGDRFYLPEGVAVTDYSNSAAGFRYSTSVDGKMTGRHADAVYVDDPTKPKDLTKVSLEKVRGWWRTTVPTRFRDPKNRRRLAILQRLHYLDLAGLFKEEGAHCLVLPMEFEPTARSFGDPRTQEGELLWPGRFDVEAVRKLKKDLGPVNAAAQLQQRPTPEGGAIFKLEWRKYWTTRPITEDMRDRYVTRPARFDAIVLSVDCAFKDTEDSDFVAIKVWGRKGADFYALDRVVERLGFGGTCEAIRLVKRRWPQAFRTLIEDKANGSAVIETLRKDISGIVPVDPEGGKVSRANAVTGLFEAGNVFDPDPTLPGFAWSDDTWSQRIAFPKGEHDDEVDADTQALVHLHQKRSGWEDAAKAVKERGGRIM